MSTSTERALAILTGIKEVDYWEDIDGGVWVLRRIPVANVKEQINAAIESTCADRTLFAGDTDVAVVMAKLEKALDEYFPDK